MVAGLAAVAFFYGAAIQRTSTYSSGGTSGSVTITATNYEIGYAGGGSYFGPSSQTTSNTIMSTTDNEISYTITLSNMELFASHMVNSITTRTPGFVLVSSYPDLPASVSPGGRVSITLIIRTPSSEYYGTLSFLISTS